MGKGKNHGRVITFDPAARKDFLTGFHRRKTERRKRAQSKAEERARKEKLEARKEKREYLKQQRSIGQGDAVLGEDEDDPDCAPAGSEKETFNFQGMLATATVTPLETASDWLHTSAHAPRQAQQTQPKGAAKGQKRAVHGGGDGIRKPKRKGMPQSKQQRSHGKLNKKR